MINEFILTLYYPQISTINNNHIISGAGDAENGFFDAEHMVWILIVFVFLVSCMFTSILVSCWGKIQERKRRQREYHMKKSTETSIDGQLNKIGKTSINNLTTNNQSQQQQQQQQLQQEQIYAGTNSLQNNMDIKRRLLTSAIVPSDINNNNIKQPQQQLLSGGNRLLMNDSSMTDSLMQLQQQQYHQQRLMNQLLTQQQQLADVQNHGVGITGVYGQQMANNSNTSLADNVAMNKESLFGSRSKTFGLHSSKSALDDGITAASTMLDNNSNINKASFIKQQSILAQSAQQQQQQLQQQVDLNKQHSVPNIHHSFSSKQQKGPAVLGAADPSLSEETIDAHQQMLNLSNLARQQSTNHHQNYITTTSSINQQASSNDNNSTPGGPFLRHQQQNVFTNIPSQQQAQTMPISLAKQLSFLKKQQDLNSMNYDSGVGINHQQNGDNPQRALTLSTMHQPISSSSGLYSTGGDNHNHQRTNIQTIYGFNNQQQFVGAPINNRHNNINNLSNSLTCCNLIANSDCSNETPLINDLLSRVDHQRALHQLSQQQQQQNNRIYELRSNTLGSRVPSSLMPRSISAHQLSQKALNLRTQQQQHYIQQQQQQQQPSFNKSISDAGHANRHQPPNHSLSYPHACTGAHQAPDDGSLQQRFISNQSPGLPPPPPPPNLRSSTACGGTTTFNQQQQQQQQQQSCLDNRRAAFKISRFDTSQLTSDTTLQEQEQLQMFATTGSMQFDEQSSESDATFGMLMNSVGAGQQHHPPPPAPLGGTIATPTSNLQQRQMLTHLSGCNFIRCQQANLINRQELITNQPIVCDCGALERATNNFIRQQQQQLHLQQMGNSSRDYDDSDEIVVAGPIIQQHQHQHPVGLRPSFQQQLTMTTKGLLQQQQNPGGLLLSSSNAANLYGGVDHHQQQQQQQQQLQGKARQQRFGRFQHQSSELTNEDEDDDDGDEDDDEDIDDNDGVVYEDDVDDIMDEYGQLDEEVSSDNNNNNNVIGMNKMKLNKSGSKQAVKVGRGNISAGTPITTTGYRSIIRNEELKDSASSLSACPPGLVNAAGQHTKSRNKKTKDRNGNPLAGSHTSISCHSCTCGSQLQLDQVDNNNNNDNQQQTNNNNTIDNNDESSSNASKSNGTTTTTTTTNQVATTIDNNDKQNNNNINNLVAGGNKNTNLVKVKDNKNAVAVPSSSSSTTTTTYGNVVTTTTKDNKKTSSANSNTTNILSAGISPPATNTTIDRQAPLGTEENCNNNTPHGES